MAGAAVAALRDDLLGHLRRRAGDEFVVVHRKPVLASGNEDEAGFTLGSPASTLRVISLAMRPRQAPLPRSAAMVMLRRMARCSDP